eukprot:CAMPEP_0194374994 /NCGR_PEP_ID=MMETSP0174-20130528/23448_1 /TAXON_ID=216777 /ORGANISM="Proboscia alata, Strain PI-D3" /LENGTH=462 /DNA_ID=CAMNT_0039154897 /DNA_START=77 /DNA_END=1461 /DNA_ORIENTATION=-
MSNQPHLSRPTPHTIAVSILISMSHTTHNVATSFSSNSSVVHSDAYTFFNRDDLIHQLISSHRGTTATMSGGGEGYCLSHLLWQLPSVSDDQQSNPLLDTSESNQFKSFSAEELLRRLTNVMDSIDSLLDFMEYCAHSCRSSNTDEETSNDTCPSDATSWLPAWTLDRQSLQGVYVRRMCLGFEGLPFECVGRLWKALRRYASEGTARWKGIVTGAGAVTSVVRTRGCSWTQSSIAHITPGDGSSEPRLTHDLIGVVPFHSMEEELQRVLRYHPEVPYLHYLCFLNCVYHHERIGAIDSLHRYYDYAMIQHRRNLASNTSTTGGGSDAGVAGGGGNSMLQQNAALLALASYHSHLGDETGSWMATQEAMRVSQRNGDEAAVALALGWMLRNTPVLPTVTHNRKDIDSAQGLTRGVEEGEKERMLRRCATRAGGSSDAFLSLAELLARQPSRPRRVWRAVMAA